MKVNIKINEALPGPHVKRRAFLCKQAAATLASCLLSICSGLTFGITAVMLPQLREDKVLHYNPSHDSWIASISTFSMIIGSLTSGTIQDSYGRRAAHIILGIPFIIGWIVIACANSTGVILVGRFITGLSTGANKAITMVYIGEIADPKFRAAALFLPGLTSHLGTLFSHIIGFYMHWKTSCYVCLIPAVISSFAFLFLKESPLWLIAKGRTDEGIETFRWFRGTDEASEIELKAVLEKQFNKPKMSARETLKIVCTKAFIKPMLVLLVVMLDIQYSGVNVLSFYSQDIFKRAFSGNVDPFIMMIVMDCIRGVVSFGICLVGKSIPRKIALLISSFGVSLSILALVICLMMDFENFIWAPVTSLLLYICFGSAIVTVGWTFVPELLPSNGRGIGAGLNSAVSFLSLFVVVKTAPDFMISYGEPALFAVFGIATFVCGFVLIFVLPETNGKTLQSIEDSYSKNKVEQSTL